MRSLSIIFMCSVSPLFSYCLEVQNASCEKGVFLIYADPLAPTPWDGFSVADETFHLDILITCLKIVLLILKITYLKKLKPFLMFIFFSSGSYKEILPKQYFLTWIRISTRLLWWDLNIKNLDMIDIDCVPQQKTCVCLPYESFPSSINLSC